MAVAGSEGVDALYDKAPDLEKRRELVIVPTTCGTGSEVTNISIMARTRMGTKLGLVSPAMYADQAVLIPELLEGLPFGVFATSSIDAWCMPSDLPCPQSHLPANARSGTKAIEMLVRGYPADCHGWAGEPNPGLLRHRSTMPDFQSEPPAAPRFHA